MTEGTDCTDPGEPVMVDTEEDCVFEEETWFPKELRALTERTFRFEEELEKELWNRGFADLPVVLDPMSGRAIWRRPSGAHNKITTECSQLFLDDWNGTASVSNPANVYIHKPNRGLYLRQPDLAFWGPDKTVNVQKRGRTMSIPLELDLPPQRFGDRDQVANVNPDVVIQFSWKMRTKKEQSMIL